MRNWFSKPKKTYQLNYKIKQKIQLQTFFLIQFLIKIYYN